MLNHSGQGHIEGLGRLEDLQSAGIEFSLLMQRGGNDEKDDEEDEDDDENSLSTLSRIASGSRSRKRANTSQVSNFKVEKM